MGDLFPGIKKPVIDYGSLFDSMKAVMAKKNLQPHPWFIEKVIQLYEMIVVRHGLMVVGQPFSGKSSSLKVLGDALGELAEKGLNDENKVKTVHVNPKSVTMGQLYGETDRATQVAEP